MPSSGLKLLRTIVVATLIVAATPAAAGIIEEDLTDLLRDAYGLPSAELTVTVQLDLAVPPELEPAGGGTRFIELMLDRASGRFAVVALVPLEANMARLPLSGQVTALAEVPVLRDMVTRGQLVTRDLVDHQLLPANRLAGGIVVDAADLVGQAARRTLHANRPIRAADLMPPIVVAKNNLVHMVYEVGALRLTARGRALADGGAGAMIKVLNIDSKRTVDAMVISSDTVAVIRGEQP
jgi:flagella basal body P-ring formation protein FlgA